MLYFGVIDLSKIYNVNVDRIKKLAQDKGITMKHLATSIKKYPTFLSCVRNGTDNISESELAVIAARLSTTVAYLTNQTDDPDNAKMKDILRVNQLLRIVEWYSIPQMDELLVIAENISAGASYTLPAGQDTPSDEEKELLEVYQKLGRSAKRQLLGKAYELLDAQSAQQTGDSIAPSDVDLASTRLDAGVKK